jgi:hypothetical protein
LQVDTDGAGNSRRLERGDQATVVLLGEGCGDGWVYQNMVSSS